MNMLRYACAAIVAVAVSMPRLALAMVDDSGWRPGPSPEWFVNWDKALAEARKTGKTMFVLKTGDWSSVHGDLRKQVLQRDEFLEFAGKNLVLVYLSDAKSNPLGREQRRHNWFITDILAYGHASQKMRLFTSDGVEIESDIDCREKVDVFLAKLERALADRLTKSVALEAKRLFSEGYDKVSSEFFLKRDLFSTSTNEFKVALTGIAVGKSRQYGDEVEFLPPEGEIRIPLRSSARFRIEYDVPKGFKVRFSVWEKRDSDSRKPFRVVCDYSQWCTGKGIAYTFLKLSASAEENHRVKNVEVRISTEPTLDGSPYGWTAECIPVNLDFMAATAEQDANRSAVSKCVSKGCTEDFEAATEPTFELRSGRVVFTGPQSMEKDIKCTKEKYESILPFVRAIYGEPTGSEEPFQVQFQKKEEGCGGYVPGLNKWTVFAGAGKTCGWFWESKFPTIWYMACCVHNGPGEPNWAFIAFYLEYFMQEAAGVLRSARFQIDSIMQGRNRDADTDWMKKRRPHWAVFGEFSDDPPAVFREYFREKRTLFEKGVIGRNISLSDEAAIFSRVLGKDVFHVFVNHGLDVSKRKTKIPLDLPGGDADKNGMREIRSYDLNKGVAQ